MASPVDVMKPWAFCLDIKVKGGLHVLEDWRQVKNAMCNLLRYLHYIHSKEGICLCGLGFRVAEWNGGMEGESKPGVKQSEIHVKLKKIWKAFVYSILLKSSKEFLASFVRIFFIPPQNLFFSI